MTITAHGVGPDGGLAADHQLGIALTTLWHDVAVAGASVDVDAGAGRPQVAARAAAVIGAIKAGTSTGVALTQARQLVGFGCLTPGSGRSAHTGAIGPLLMDPGQATDDLLPHLMSALLERAAARGLRRVELSLVAGADSEISDLLQQRFGFQVSGRRPGWVRDAHGSEDDELLLWAVVPTS